MGWKLVWLIAAMGAALSVAIVLTAVFIAGASMRDPLDRAAEEEAQRRLR